MKLLVILLMFSSHGLVAVSQLRAQIAPQPQPSTAELLSAAKQALQANAANIQSVTAQGRIRHLRFQRNVATPSVTLDADLLLTYAPPSFRLLLQYAPRESRASTDDPSPAQPNERSQRELDQQLVLFDGKTVITVEHSRDGGWRGDIYFDFHKQNMLRMAGFPFEDPVALWNEALQIDRADLLASSTTPLAGGGFMGVLTKETYRLKYYFLSEFGYDLRRVSSYRLGEDIPFRDWHLNWQQSQGIHYVERLVRRINDATTIEALASSTGLSHEQVELQYQTFTINPVVDPQAFELSTLVVPDGTPFYDHRVNVNGKPKLTWWNAGELTTDAK